MVDIDNFKAINDLYGHVNKDEVLRILSMKAKKINNQYTKFYRFGGDEFIAIIRSNNIDNIQRVVDNAK